jgi:hypothetical protein
MTATKESLIRRSLRRFTLGSGPLKRRSDRFQVIGRFVVALSFLLAPLLAVAAATTTTVHLQAVAESEAAERSRTRAVLLEDAPARTRPSSDYGNPPPRTVPVRAAWPVADGTSREGTVLVPPRTPVGTAVPVWVNRQGNPTSAPLERARIPGSAAATGALALIGVPMAAWTLYAFLCLALDAHRERRWAQDWAAVEPVWNSRLR